MTERDFIRLDQDGLQWPLKKHFLVTRFIELYYLLSDVARYERASALRTLTKANTHKSVYYRKVAEILAQ